MAEPPLSPLQLDILALEDRFWKQDGAKISEFRRLHPHVTRTGYDVALGRLLKDRRAYEYAGGRYAGLLNRLAGATDEAIDGRTTHWGESEAS